MLRNYLKTAVRSLLRHRFFSSINIFGLSVGMSICMGIIMLVADQMMYDRYNTKRDRIYRINTITIGRDGRENNESATTTLPVLQEIVENYTGVERAVRIKRGFGNSWIEFDQDVNIPVSGYFADPGVLDMFEYELEHGDPKTALTEPYSVVLTKKAARKLFRQDNPVGEILKVGDSSVYKVTGVIRETKRKSHIVFDALASMATVKSLEALGKPSKALDNWFNHWEGWVYIQLDKDIRVDAVRSNLKDIEKKHFSKLTSPETQDVVKYKLQSLMSITPGPLINNPIGPFLPWMFIYFFAGIAGVILVTSCFNFTNLSIARSLTRAREIGVRKVTGAMRWQIFSQFISESVIISLISLLIAVVFLIVLKPLILQLSFARIMRWDLELNYYVFGVFLALAVVVGILAGLFPAIVLSGFQPVKVLKNMGDMKLFSRMGLRKALLTVQFTFSLIFILTVIVVFNQMKLFMTADHGFTMENKIVVLLNHTSYQNLKTELLKYPNIENVSSVSHIPAAGESRGEGYKRTLDEKEWSTIDYFSVDEDYIKNMDIPLVAGKFYSAEAGESNKNFIVLSEKAVSTFHFNSPAEAIGQDIIIQHDSTKRTIIGVVKNYNHQLLMEKMDPMALIFDKTQFHSVQVRYTGTFADASKSVEASWAKVNPNLKIDCKDFSGEVHKIYNIFFGDLGDILRVISILAVLISCLGLLGMATYATESRKKEISIRKVLGSNNTSLVYLLSKGFFGILIIAVVLAVPAAYFLNGLWLDKMAYHVAMDGPVIFLGIALLLLFGILTIGSQTWRATFVNPVENLKGE